jgi:hypothetical protein
LNIQWIPDILEGKLYKLVVEMAVNACFAALKPLDGISIANHHIEVEIAHGDRIPDLPMDVINTENLHVIVDKLVANKNVNEVWLPEALKRDLLFHILYLILSVMQVFVGHTECDVVGHTIAASIKKGTVTPRLHREPSCINHDDLVKYMKKTAGAAAAAADSTEQSLYKIVFLIVLAVIEEVFVDFRMNLIGDSLQFHLVPGGLALSSVVASAESAALALPSGSESGKDPTISKKEALREEAREHLAAKLREEADAIEERISLIDRQLAVCDGEIKSRKAAGQKGPLVSPSNLRGAKPEHVPSFRLIE